MFPDLQADIAERRVAAVADRQVAHCQFDVRRFHLCAGFVRGRLHAGYHFFLPRSQARKAMERAFMNSTRAMSIKATP